MARNTQKVVEPADIEPVTPEDGPANVLPVPAAEDRLAALERLVQSQAATIDGFAALLKKKAEAVEVPAGFRLVKDEPTDKEREADLAAAEREISRGNDARSQDVAFDRYPNGRHVYRVHLPDKNGHPELAIRADTETDARARYLDVCGVRSTETQLSCQRA